MNQLYELVAFIKSYQEQFPTGLTEEEERSLGIVDGVAEPNSVASRIKTAGIIDGYAMALFPNMSPEQVAEAVDQIYTYVYYQRTSPQN
jgi:hypothetical protein